MPIFGNGSFWIIEKVSSTRWELVGGSDTVTASVGTFVRMPNGRLEQSGRYSSGVAATASIQTVSGRPFPISFVNTTVEITCSAFTDSSWSGFQLFSVTLDNASTYSVICFNTSVIQNCTWVWQAVGRWY